MFRLTGTPFPWTHAPFSEGRVPSTRDGYPVSEGRVPLWPRDSYPFSDGREPLSERRGTPFHNRFGAEILFYASKNYAPEG